MNRSEALRAGCGSLASFAGVTPAGRGDQAVPLSEFAFAVIGLFVQPGRLYYSRASDPELPLVHSVDAEVHFS